VKFQQISAFSAACAASLGQDRGKRSLAVAANPLKLPRAKTGNLARGSRPVAYAVGGFALFRDEVYSV
jgi:hypothetical protein